MNEMVIEGAAAAYLLMMGVSQRRTRGEAILFFQIGPIAFGTLLGCMAAFRFLEMTPP